MFGERIAEGRVAEVYAWGDRHIVKLWKPGFPPQDAAYEYAIVRNVMAAGIPTPAALEQTQVNGRAGIVYQRVDGQTMDRVALQDLSHLTEMAQQMATLHLAIHSRNARALPSQLGKLRARIARIGLLDASAKASLIARLDDLPDGEAVCHGDLHPQNIIMTNEGPVAIDWIDASQGHASVDVARSMLLMQMLDHYGDVPADVKQAVAEFRDGYLNHYLALSGLPLESISKWLPVLAAARLGEDIPEETDILLQMARA